MATLTPQQKKFVEVYLSSGFDRHKAIAEAGYSVKNADSIACKLLKKSQIQREIDQYFDQQVEKTSVEVGEIIQQLRRIAFAPASGRVTNSDRIRACEVLGKVLGLFKDGLAVGVCVNNQVPQMDPEEEAALMEIARQNNLRLSRTPRKPI